jgi:ABC-2 type transport system ATP-binding protein
MIEATALTKRYGGTVAVEDLSFTVPPGQVTGFLGPNGAGKSTTMRLILGLDAPTSGSVTVNGRRYDQLSRPLLQVGALLDANATHGGRSAYDHLLWLALSNGIRRRRVDEVLDQVGLRSVAGKRVGGFSLGMAQHLGIAAALLGDPSVFVFDEPVNGLDPEGVLWIRTLLKSLAAEGRTVLISSHLMSEMSITADRLIIIGRGRLISQTSIAELLVRSAGSFVLDRSNHPGDPECVAGMVLNGCAGLEQRFEGGLDAHCRAGVQRRLRRAGSDLPPRPLERARQSPTDPRPSPPAIMEDHHRSLRPDGSRKSDFLPTPRTRRPRTLDRLRRLRPLRSHGAGRCIPSHQPARRMSRPADETCRRRSTQPTLQGAT